MITLAVIAINNRKSL